MDRNNELLEIVRAGRRPALLIAVFVMGVSAESLTLPRTIPQGGTLRIRGSASAAAARMGERRIRMFPEAGGGTLGLMPVGALDKPGPYRVELLDRNEAPVVTAAVRVVDAHFRRQNVVMGKATTELKPSPGEQETSSAFRKTVSDVRYWAEPLTAPVKGCMTSPFGVQRYWNGKPTGDYHGGLDQRAPLGTPVHAVSAGVVQIVREWNLRGGTIGVDHGQGLETLYMHLSKLAVAEGAKVNRGDVIGYSGSTGRSAAPHLHWTLYVNGVPVNPLGWVRVQPCAAAQTVRKRK